MHLKVQKKYSDYMALDRSQLWVRSKRITLNLKSNKITILSELNLLNKNCVVKVMILIKNKKPAVSVIL